MGERIAVVTGGNKGLGLEIVRALCRSPVSIVYLTARSASLGNEAVKILEKEGLHPKFHILDIDSTESIKKFTDYMTSTHGGLDILVNNAAIAYKNDATEPFSEQAEETVRVNFFGTLHVCEQLFPLLRPHGRVVTLSSFAGLLPRINGKEPEATALKSKLASPSLTTKELIDLANSFVNLTKENKHSEAGWPGSAYAVSKVLLTALVGIQQREFDKSLSANDLVINAVHPGYLDTDMTSHKGKTPASDGAKAPIIAALLPPNVKEPRRGGFFWEDGSIVSWITGPLPKST